MSERTEEQAALAEAFGSYLAKASSPERVRAAEPLGFDRDLWRGLAAMGVPSMGVPTDRGGGGATMADLAVVAEQVGRHLAPAPVVEALVACRLLSAASEGAALTEVLLDGTAVPTLALVPAVDGRCRLVPAGAVADVVVALDGQHLAVARGTPPGRAPANLGSSPLADRSTHGAEIIDDAGAVSAYGRALTEWKVLTAAALAGLAASALDLGVAYVKDRVQFGAPIGSFQAVQHRLADVATAVEGARLLAQGAARAQDERRPDAARLTSLALAFAAETAQSAAAASLHFHGGYGFLVEYDIQLFYRRAKAWSLAGGDPRLELRRAGRRSASATTTTSTGEAAAFVAEHVTAEVVDRARRTGTMHDWGLHRALAERGWLADPPPDLREALARAGAPVDGLGTSRLVAETLLRAGTERQQAEVVPRIHAGEIVVCLGYSEPDAGSDVAAATTRAARDGDEWVIDGAKMFTTLAQEAAYVFLLARTNPDVAKHRGLTMFLVPLDRPGIEIRPIETLGGERTNATFYNGVRVGDAARVGAVDGGWGVMTVALAFERQPAAHYEAVRLLERVVAWAEAAGMLDDPAVAERIGRVAMDNEVGRVLGEALADAIDGGELGVVEGSMAKLFTSEALTRAAADLLDLFGPEAVLQHGEAGAPAEGGVEHAHRHAAVTTIYAGTSEIQRSIIAERALGLPRSR